MIVKKRNAVIWCEVHCDACGAVHGADYRNAKTISRLKALTKNWKIVETTENGTMQLCHECLKAYECGV